MQVVQRECIANITVGARDSLGPAVDSCLEPQDLLTGQNRPTPRGSGTREPSSADAGRSAKKRCVVLHRGGRLSLWSVFVVHRQYTLHRPPALSRKCVKLIKHMLPNYTRLSRGLPCAQPSIFFFLEFFFERLAGVCTSQLFWMTLLLSPKLFGRGAQGHSSICVQW